MTHKVFVYGTLKRGFHNHRLIENSEFLGAYETESIYTMYSFGGFPAVAKEGETSIYGEIYDVSDEELSYLDRLEGHPRWYCREQINTGFGKVWIYLMPKEDLRNHDVVITGVWDV